MLSKEDVVYAYRLLFGREPEDEAVVRHYATEVHDLQSLRALFTGPLNCKRGGRDQLYVKLLQTLYFN